MRIRETQFYSDYRLPKYPAQCFPAEKQRSMDMITIKEIARQLHMSTTTVSNVIHGKTKEVSPDTIAKVQAFLDQVGYVPNISARNLAQNQSKIIGLVLKTQWDRYVDQMNDPFVTDMISGIERVIRQSGYFMMVYMSDDIAEIIHHVSTWNVDGLLLFCMMDDDSQRVSERYKNPIVCIDTYREEKGDRFVNIGLDDEEGGYLAARYLIECGHRKIGFMAENIHVGVDMMRFRGYRRALREAGIEYSDRNFFRLRVEKDEIDRSMERMCDRAGDYTAVLCASDLFAVDFMSHLYDRGILVPEKLSVVGFDDNLYGRLHRPALTTVHQDPAQKGSLAAQTLISMIRGNEPEERQIIMKPSLVVRDTVRKIQHPLRQ